MSEPELPHEPDDWFDRLLDESLVGTASIHEPSAEERLAIAERKRRAADLAARLQSGTPGTEVGYRFAPADAFEPFVDEPRRNQRLRRRRVGRLLVALIVVAALGVVYLQPFRTSSSDVSSSSIEFGEDQVYAHATGFDSPTPSGIEDATPLGTPSEAPNGGGTYLFIASQLGSATPVAYDPCRPITFVVNNENMPEGGNAMVDDAIAEVSRVTGLVFEFEGATSETVGEQRSPFQPERYGDRWAPVLIWWASPSTAPDLSGDVAGFAGSAAARTTDNEGRTQDTYVSGTIVLDGDQLGDLLRFSDGSKGITAVILHELAHLVGLNHVNDRSQLMNPVTSGLSSFQAGDLRGLIELGRGKCDPQL